MVLDQVNREGGRVLGCVFGLKTSSLRVLCVLAHCPDEGGNKFPTTVGSFDLFLQSFQETFSNSVGLMLHHYGELATQFQH